MQATDGLASGALATSAQASSACSSDAEAEAPSTENGATLEPTAVLKSTSVAAVAIRTLLELKSHHEREIEELQTQHELEIQELKAQLMASGPPPNPSQDSMFKFEKRQFIELVRGAIRGKSSPEYKRLYHYLLKCFTDADNNFDGRVGFKEFEMLIETAAFLPRRFGYAPSTPELYETDWERLQARMSLFNTLKCSSGKSPGTKEEYISFGQWLEYAIGHIVDKAKSLNYMDERPEMEQSKDSFRDFIIAASKSRKTREYKELYHFLLKCFTDADTELSGLINFDQFNELVDRAVVVPRRFGFAPQTSDIYANVTEKLQERGRLFSSLDASNTGFIDFDTWLNHMYSHICEKTTMLGESGIVPEVVSTGSSQGKSSRTYSSCVRTAMSRLV